MASVLTERVRLLTSVLLGPVRANPALFAKQAASLDRLSNGLLVLGMAVVATMTFRRAASTFTSAAKQLDHLVDEAQRIWAGESRGTADAIGPRPVRQGGSCSAASHRPASVVPRSTARLDRRWQRTPSRSAGAAAREAWAAAGRPDKPWLVGLAYFALGPQARERSRRLLPGHGGPVRTLDREPGAGCHCRIQSYGLR
jgi:alkanesulfonate monooxygenase SsuD/methylene tetrahydromethanopterin reductase-like flavin-dependent oxidoreductase (luciferase family)